MKQDWTSVRVARETLGAVKRVQAATGETAAEVVARAVKLLERAEAQQRKVGLP